MPCISEESSPALGHGWRLGFLGILHMEVFSQRLQQEFNAEVMQGGIIRCAFDKQILVDTSCRYPYGV